MAFVALGTVSAYAQGAQSNCEQSFAQYAGDKGFMSQNDFEQYWDDSGHTDQDTMGNAPVGGAYTAFQSANTSGNDQLSKAEFCAWVNRP